MERVQFCSVIRFLVMDGKTCEEIKAKLDEYYGNHSPSMSTVRHWCNEFKRREKIGPARFDSPLEAFHSRKKEKLAYVVCVSAKWKTNNEPDIVATIDLDPTSPTYSKIIHKLEMPYLGDELHHWGWNACSNWKDYKVRRHYMIAPGINSSRIYIIDVASNPRSPKIYKVIESEDLHEIGKSSSPNTVHCLPNGDILISCLGNEQGEAKGTFIVLEQGTFRLKGTWQKEGNSIEYNYDYWYQPLHNVMVSTEWAAPNIFKKGFFMEDILNGRYGHCINFWDWNQKKRIQKIDFGNDGLIPLKVRFHHNPESDLGYVGCAFSSTVFQFHKHDGSWASNLVVRIPPKKVQNWIFPEMPGFITDILISLDDRNLYISNWLHGDIRQYDISDSNNVRQVGQIFIGGSICKDEKVIVTEDTELEKQPVRPTVNGKPVRGGPQMLQLSLDGKRLYVTNSLFSSWDAQFYKENIEKGSMMFLVHVNTEYGGLTLDKNFLIDFGLEGNYLAHEMRFPKGDSTSDIWELNLLMSEFE
ncbi:methanethiol oxidase [Nephila pilipes]|uniref:Methanethiol oxidase n=1 Tax=Nephila pilipes TaxID=299642 RepID=A0A8X6TXP5_NEPPI|nr:methanethiol oxidase [Nephila pilipes]